MSPRQQRYNWLLSQLEWHRGRGTGWHRSQVAHYRRQLKTYSLSEIVGFVIAKHAHKISANITASNALFRRLSAPKS